jgi:hypothetical protein
MQQEKRYSFWDFSQEILEARGIVHAHKLAIRHAKEITKLYNKPIRIEKVIEVGSE